MESGIKKDDAKRVSRITLALLGAEDPCKVCAHRRSMDEDAAEHNARQCKSPQYDAFVETYHGHGGSDLQFPEHVNAGTLLSSSRGRLHAWRDRAEPTRRVPWLVARNVLKFACKGDWFEPK